MDNKKSDRGIAAAKLPAASPNRRSTKQQRGEDKGKTMKETDDEMKEIQGKEVIDVSQDLQTKFDNANVDWKKRMTAAGKNGWIIDILPGPVEAWGGLTETKRKEVNGFLAEDLKLQKWPLLLKDGWKEVKSIYQVDADSTFGDKLSVSLAQDKATTMFGRK